MNLFSRCSPVRFAQIARRCCPTFFRNLLDHAFISQTNNYSNLTWLGNPIWQNIADLWLTQEVIASLRPSLLIETGTNRGGSSLFYAHLMDLIGHGSVVTMDVERLHNLSHPRITYLLGDSTSPELVRQVCAMAAAVTGPVLVILDSDHSEAHVAAELLAYYHLITPQSYILVQDGIIDTLPGSESERPGPLPAIEQFLSNHPEFQIDEKLCRKFPISHHPKGWLKRIA